MILNAVHACKLMYIRRKSDYHSPYSAQFSECLILSTVIKMFVNNVKNIVSKIIEPFQPNSQLYMKFRETGSENGLLKGLSYNVTTCKQDLYTSLTQAQERKITKELLREMLNYANIFKRTCVRNFDQQMINKK